MKGDVREETCERAGSRQLESEVMRELISFQFLLEHWH